MIPKKGVVCLFVCLLHFLKIFWFPNIRGLPGSSPLEPTDTATLGRTDCGSQEVALGQSGGDGLGHIQWRSLKVARGGVEKMVCAGLDCSTNELMTLGIGAWETKACNGASVFLGQGQRLYLEC